MSQMSAVVFTGRQTLDVRTLKKPECGRRDALMQVAACGLCGSDARRWFHGDHSSECARIPGHEPAGVLVEVGSEVHGWKPGDRIALAADIHCGHCFYCRLELPNLCEDHKILGHHVDGALCDYMLLPEQVMVNGIVNRVPDSLPLLHAATAEPICSVLAAHDELAIAAEETVLVIGCGPMGVLHAILARRRGARVIVVDISASRLSMARRSFSIEHAIDASQVDLVEAVSALTAGRGVDVVICAAPSAEPVRLAPQLARKRGRIGLFAGVPRTEALAPLDINRIHYAEQRLIGNFSYHPRYHRQALELLAGGAIDCDSLIRSYSLAETEAALYDIREGRVLKAVVTPRDGEPQ